MAPQADVRGFAVAGLLVAALLLGGCARSARQIVWDRDFAAAREARDLRQLDALAEQAPRAVDEAAASFEAAELAFLAGSADDGAARLRDLAHHGPRRMDRARARLRLADLAEARGRLDLAEQFHRALVVVYPDLMPGERALVHLLRLARASDASRGQVCENTHKNITHDGKTNQDPPDSNHMTSCGPAVDRHLAFTRAVWPELRATPLGDNLLFQAASEVERRARATGDASLAALAERLYLSLTRDFPHGGLWDDAMWQRSWLHHARGAWRDEIAAIAAIQRRRELVSFFGQDEHPYFYLGQRRIARLWMVELDDPAAARAAWHVYADTWTRSVHRDDAWFFAACCAARLGDLAAARADLARIAEDRPESRHLAHAELAIHDPRGPRCTPPEVTP